MRFFYTIVYLFVSYTMFANNTYNITVRTLVKGSYVPDANFTLAVRETEYKGFEARIQTHGYGGKGFDLSIEEDESEAMKIAQFERESAEEFARDEKKTPKEKIEELISFTTKKLSDVEKNKKSNEAKILSLKANLAKYKASYDRARSSASEMKRLGDFISANREELFEIKKPKMSTSRKVDSSYQGFGTSIRIGINKVENGIASISLDYSYSNFLGWMSGGGSNNGNSMTSLPRIEFIEMEGITQDIPLGKDFCFQFARPSDEGKTLESAMNSSEIFSNFSRNKKVKSDNRAKVETLETFDSYSNILKKFSGKENSVIRVIITITKSN